MNKQSLTFLNILLCFSPVFLIGQHSGNCDTYFPCTPGAQIQWQTHRIDNNKPSSEWESIEIIAVNSQSIQYNRNLTVLAGGSGNTVQFSHQGEVLCSSTNCTLGPDFFLPRPAATLSSYFNPPTISYTGPSCELPNNPILGPLPDCNSMKIVVESNTSNASSNPFLEGSTRFEFEVSYTQRKVLSEHTILEINTQQIPCVIIQERRHSTGAINETVFEVSWLAKGVGKIRSVFFQNDPGANWNSTSGSIGSRRAIVF